MRIVLLTILAMTVFTLHGNAETLNPYAAVARRNVFGLKAPETFATESPAPLAAVKVFGVVNLFGYQQVITQINGTNYILREGEAREGVEIVKIESRGSVEVQNHGAKQSNTWQ